MDKRAFLKTSAGAAIAANAGLLLPFSARAASLKRQMPVPKLLESVNESPIELSMGAGEWQLLAGINTPTIGFNGPYLGPTVRVREGQNLPLIYNNNLSEYVSVHAHGLHIPGELDGGPQRKIEPGDSWSVELPIRQQASTCWYHPHTHGKTGPQTYHGLAGFFIVDDDNSDSLPLPKTYGLDDLPVVVQDRTFDSLGRFVYSTADMQNGMLAQTITVNGITNPIRSVPAGLVRLRLLNGSNARYYRFHFSDKRVFHKIATEGGFLEEPVPLAEITMLPGERNEIVVDFSDGNPALLVSGPEVATGSDRQFQQDNDRGNRDGRNNRNFGGLNDYFEILEFAVDPELPVFRGPLPSQLNSVSRPTVGRNWPRREFAMFMRDGNRRDRNNGVQANTEMIMGINGQPMDMGVINERVKKGQWEHWTIRSYDGSHPFHVHGASFLLTSQEGRPVAVEDSGWKDTVRVDNRAEFILRFDHKATQEYPYMYHCHILEHEDKGMMGQFTVS